MKKAELLTTLLRYHRTSTRRIHLIPSENAMSLVARMPFITDVVHRYCFASDGENWSWPGNLDLVAIEESAAEGLRALFGARHVNLKPISGLNCMAVAMSALAERGSAVLSLGTADGGHGSTGFLAGRLGLTNFSLPYDRVRFSIDIDRLGSLIATVQSPKVVYLDQFMCLFPHDLAGIRTAVGPETVIHYDGSHVLGLIAGGQFQDPLREGADSLGGSTHKSFPGPHKGVLMTNSSEIARLIDHHASFWVSHHHPADVTALAIAIADFQEIAHDYATRTVGNARHLGGALSKRGFNVCAEDRGFTRSHQLWLDVAAVIDPMEASKRLLEAGIVINAIDVPYLPTGVGLRLGVQEVTLLGMDANDMDWLAHILDRLLIAKDEPRQLEGDVEDLLRKYQVSDHDQVLDSVLRAISQLGVDP